MHNDESLVAARSITDAGTMAVAFQNRLSQSAEVFFVLPHKRIARPTETMGNASPALPAFTSLLRNVPIEGLPANAVLSGEAGLGFTQRYGRHNSFASAGVNECFRPTYAPSRSFAKAMPPAAVHGSGHVRTARKPP